MIKTKKDVDNFLKDFEDIFVTRKSRGYAFFPVSFRGFFGCYAMIYYYYKTGLFEVSFNSQEIKSTNLEDVKKFIWDKKDEINYTLSKKSICTCRKCGESRWYAVHPTNRTSLKDVLCSSCHYSFRLIKEVEDEYYSFPSM